MKNLIRPVIYTILNQLFTKNNVRIIGKDFDAVEKLIVLYVLSEVSNFSRELCIRETKSILQEPDIHHKIIITFLK